MRRVAPTSATSEADKPEVIILSIRLESGRFNTEVRVPLMGQTPEQVQETMARWLDLTQMAIKIGVTEMDAAMPEQSR